jgi:alpha-glucosidase
VIQRVAVQCRVKMRLSSIAVLLCAVALSFSAELEWWEGGNFYQIYPRSFKDSNDDGVGDLLGIASKVEYLKELGMDGVWLSPIMASPQADFGYDISNYRDIHSEYGTLADFEVLLEECKKHDVKLILDLVPNHSSNEHEFFKKSENREPGYENYYIWHPGKTDPITGKQIPPNNWVSVFRFPAWTWSPKRKEFYLHAFLYQQPDLNYRNPAVVQEIKDVMTYWLNKGVQGFRVDAVPFLFEVDADEDGNYRDEPLTGDVCPNPDDYCYTQHVYTINQPETLEMVFQWRELMIEFARNHDNVTKVMMTEAFVPLDDMIKYYGDGEREGANIPFNFEMITNVNKESTAANYKLRIDNWLFRVPPGKQANWVVSNLLTYFDVFISYLDVFFDIISFVFS